MNGLEVKQGAITTTLSLIHLRLFKAFAIAFDITSRLLFLPSDVYLLRPYLCIISFICIAVGRLDLYSLRTNLLISAILLIFTMCHRYLVICAFEYTLIFSPMRKFRVTHGTRWEPTMSSSSKDSTYIFSSVSSKNSSLFIC